MAVSPLPLLPDQYYHIYNHANASDLLFRELPNYHYFLKKYAEHCAPVVDTFAYCLMPNHFHLFVRIKPESELVSYFEMPENLSSLELQDKIAFQLSQIFSNFFNAYAKAYNRRFGRKGAFIAYSF